jgi:branched-chain amino acid transport system substrate-binding protein
MADLSGVTAVQGVNNANGMRLAFDEANAKGGVHGRKIRFIVEDMEYTVPKAVQAMNKLLNRDNIFVAVGNGGTPMNDAVMPSMIEKGVPNVFPTTCARSMYEPFNKFKFGQFASYYDQMRAGVKHFATTKGVKTVGVMYQDTDYGRDVLAGAKAQVDAMGLKLGGTTGHKPTDTDFNGAIAKLRDANCDLIVLGSIVKDTVIILQTAHKIDWNPIFMVISPPIRLRSPRRQVLLRRGSSRCRRRRIAIPTIRAPKCTRSRPSSSRPTASILTTWARPDMLRRASLRQHCRRRVAI